MSKRRFLFQSSGVALGWMLGPGLTPVAARTLTPGKEYQLINPAQPSRAEGARIEVLEFFWYACPHCFALEPVIRQWLARLPADVSFRRVHVAFRMPEHQRIHYALAELGEDERLGMEVFHAIHRDGKRMRDNDQIRDWARAQGLDADRFMTVFDSQAVSEAMRNASATVQAYDIRSVPRLAVDGRYLTSPVMAGSNEQAMQVVDALLDTVRQGH